MWLVLLQTLLYLPINGWNWFQFGQIALQDGCLLRQHVRPWLQA
jgi:hypothetical protein